MKIFMTVRWGNETEGPDGEDTLFLVAASSMERAEEISRQYLSGTDVAAHCHMIIPLDEMESITVECKLMGPLKGFAYRWKELQAWFHDKAGDPWIQESEYYGRDCE